MSWFLLLCAFITCSYSMAQFTVNQDRVVSVSPDATIQLICSRSGDSVVAFNHPTWVYQDIGSVPKLIVSSNGNDNHNMRPSTISDRFAGSISGGSAVLSIKRVQTNDGGDYYCALWSGSAWIFGEGTQLNVLTGEVKAPSVFIYGPSEEELKTDTATMVCAVSAYTPRTVSMEWTVDGTKWTKGIQTSAESKQADNLYMMSSFFSLSTSEYSKHEEYGCKVTHQGKVITQTLKRSECQ